VLLLLLLLPKEAQLVCLLVLQMPGMLLLLPLLLQAAQGQVGTACKPGSRRLPT
jgi:hypothetical protein